MPNSHGTFTKKPPAVTFAQVLLYLAALLNVGNGIYSLGSTDAVKTAICIAMIVFGIAAAFVASRLNKPDPARRQAAIALCGVLIVLRIVEFAVWSSIGFLLGLILPVLVIWRVSGPEAKAWFR
ncbi:hypothetical protein ACFFNY_34415 [Paenibacillus hodogayensis]|uniref:Uncharacterized protein n=1 Tax=Paenibacillus hodogayensis TaxID=279208 RepID=A0ABV5W876_9BACL